MFGLMQKLNDPQIMQKLDQLMSIDPSTLTNLADEFVCLRKDTRALLNILSNEYGVSVGGEGFDPRALPVIDRIPVRAAKAVDTPYLAASNLGKPISRGFIQVVGAAAVEVRFGRVTPTGEIPVDGWSGWKTLKPDQTLDITFRLDVLDIRGTIDGDSALEVFLQ